MSLGREQRKFTYAIATLIKFAFDELGVELTESDGYRPPSVFGEHGEHGKCPHCNKKIGYGSKNSVHKLKLARDLNLFVDGEYVRSSAHPVWKKLHITWKQLGGADAIVNDANHFSFEYRGFR